MPIIFRIMLFVALACSVDASASVGTKTSEKTPPPEEPTKLLYFEGFGRAPRYSFGLEKQYADEMRLGVGLSIESYRYGDIKFHNVIVPFYNWFELHRVDSHTFFISPGFNFLISQTRYPKRSFTTWGSVGQIGGGYEYIFENRWMLRGTIYLPLVMGLNFWGGVSVGYRI